MMINEENPLQAPVFEAFGLHETLMRAVAALGYTSPTPIQSQAIPVVLAGVDVMGAAQTGTGKTAGFALPILHRLMPWASESTSPARHPVRALILTPTRELADQVSSSVQGFAQFTPLRAAVVYGGVDIQPQTQALRRGVDVLIATPGRLLDHVQQKTVNLGQVQVLVLDEADRMLDMGFLPDLQRIINLLPKIRQNLLFSATFSPEIQRLANGFMVNPTLIEVARRNATSENIRQVMYTLDSEEDKRAAVAHLIRSQNLRQVIVFSNTKLGAARLARHLESEGLAATAIHGDKTQPERTKALDAFKDGSVHVLVATDVAARGLDIPDLPCVVNYDLPTTPEDYVHRIGRTGRAGAKGTAYSFMVKRHEKVLKDIEKLIGQSFALEALEGFVPGQEDKPLRRPARGEAGAGRSAPRTPAEGQDRPPRRQPSTYRGVRFDDSAPIHRDAEFERLRAKLGQFAKADNLFSQPYEPSTSALAREAAEKSGSGAAGFSTARSKIQAPRAALLGGGKSRS